MYLSNKKIKEVNNAFTLTELITVILLLGIISLIAIPSIANITKEAKEKSFKVSATQIFEGTSIYLYKHDYNGMPGEGLEVAILDTLKPNIFISGYIYMNANENYEIVNVSDGNYCANGEKGRLVITKGACEL